MNPVSGKPQYDKTRINTKTLQEKLELLMRILTFGLVGFLFLSCGSSQLFRERKYYNSDGTTMEFHYDKTFQYENKSEGGFIHEFGRGVWRQEGRKLYISEGREDSNELHLQTMIVSAHNPTAHQLVINILPRKLFFPYLPGTMELINIELVIGKSIYAINNETSIILVNSANEKGFVRAYPKPGSEFNFKISMDTLRSRYFDTGSVDSLLSIDVDLIPKYFAQISIHDDTLTIINNRKIKWGKKYYRASE